MPFRYRAFSHTPIGWNDGPFSRSRPLPPLFGCAAHRLDSQRHFFDSQLSMVAAEHERCKRRLSAVEKKCAEQSAALVKAEADRAFMEEVNASMKANQSDWQSRVRPPH